MDATFTITLLAASALTATMLTVLTVVIAGIHREEHRMNLSARPRTRAEALTRKILAVHVSEPAALRIFAARHATIAGQAITRHTIALPHLRRPHFAQPAPPKANPSRP